MKMRGDASAMYRYNVFPAPLNQRVKELSEHRFWLHGHHQNVDIEGCTTGCREPEARTSKVDRFKMKWTHGASGPVTWWVILNSSDVRIPPDFIFHEEHFVPPMNRLPSLAKWDATSPNALVKVIKELMTALQMHELKQIPESIQREYETVMSGPDVDSKFCSVNVVAGQDLVEFWIRLKLDNDPQLFADVHFKMNGRQSLVSVQLSPCLQTSVGPVRCAVNESSLERAIKSVHKELSEYLMAEKRSLNHRMNLIRDVLLIQGDSLLEVDTELFRSMELLLNYENVYVVIRIQLPPRFLEGCNDILLQAKDPYDKYEGLREDVVAIGDPSHTATSVIEASEQMARSIALRFQ